MTKKSVVLLPGLLCNAGLFFHQITALKEIADFFIPDLTQENDIKLCAKRILDQIPSQYFALGGLSMGGYIALEIIRQAPDRVQTLALMDTTALPDTDALKQKRMQMIQTAQQDGFESVIDLMMNTSVALQFRTDPSLRALMVKMADMVGIQGYKNQQELIMSRPDSRPFLKDISCPTLVFGGQEDMLTPPDLMKELANGIPNALNATIANSGHLTPLENPSAVTAILSYWLNNIGSSDA